MIHRLLKNMSRKNSTFIFIRKRRMEEGRGRKKEMIMITHCSV